MTAWEKWSKRQWDNWGSKLAPTYKKIDSWKTPDWVKKMGDKVWDLLDDEMRKHIYKFVMKTLKKFDDKFAKALIKKVFEALTDWTKRKKK